ncbi:PREDICTED: uncharacterized protein LOC109178127 [Ipomoea nil]|uniref:uncharacterized protein LOC109178127 n=1 Tax=Ipomoea nil TaxID=35883 RepID=UPI0009015502|nr:PREDICTED: uncharacterized protein LOC109178127 [Ipomoea nil]
MVDNSQGPGGGGTGNTVWRALSAGRTTPVPVPWGPRRGRERAWSDSDVPVSGHEREEWAPESGSDSEDRVLAGVGPVIPKHFVFLNVWIKHDDFLRVVRDSWQVPVEGAPMFVIATKLNRLGKVLSTWSKTVFGDIFVKLREYEDSVQALEAALQQHPEDENALIEYKKGVALLQKQIAIEEDFWQQKARITDVQDGERNSRFFHSVVKERRRKLYIHRVKGGDGVWLEDRQGIANQAVSFFEHMFTAEVGGFDLTRLDCVPRLVTEEDNEVLTAVPEVEEVKAVVMQMNSTSAAGPDGFSGAFYKACWDIIQDDVVSKVRSYFAGREFTRAITHTSIVLLPKKPSPEIFADYRPISLCNFSSKLITKLMVVRMATVLPRVLSPQQSGFVAGRSITDNVLLASEMCHGLSLQNRDIVLKLDMAKAYDRVSWFFLTSVMRRLGFSEVWIDMVFRAVSNVWYSVIVNGVKEGFFTSMRGLRQGDPLSPTLFVIAAEVLSVYIARVYDGTTVPRFTQPPRTPHIHHLAYADDVIIFSTARLRAIEVVIGALKEYEEISGQLVSFQKSAFYMHPRTPAHEIEQICQATGCMHKQFPFTYLGCPVYIGRKKCIYFASVIDKVKARCLSWQCRLLSKGGKAILISSVLQAIPLHIFSACAPLKQVIRDLERCYASFFWKQSGGARYHWSSWKTLSRPKKEGGVGFMDLDLMVRAASAKLWWNFRTDHTLWSDFMRAKYCSRVHPVAKLVQNRDSHTWKRMLAVRDEVEGVLTWRLFQGRVSFWWDNWSGLGPLGRLYPHRGVSYSRELLLDYVRDGQLDLTGHDDLAFAGIGVDLSRLGQGPRDIPLWTVASDGMFSYSSAKAFLRPALPTAPDPLLAKCWRKHLPFKVSFLAWRVFRGRLPTDDILARFGHAIVSRCRCCPAPVPESIDHIFYSGETARAAWRYVLASLGLYLRHRSLRTLIAGWGRAGARNPLLSFVVCRLPYLVLWELWKHRNGCMYGRDTPSVARVMHGVAKGVAECLFRRWPVQHILPSNWRTIVAYLEAHVPRRVIRTVRWSPPVAGALKINLSRSSAAGGAAAVVRNQEGGFCYGVAWSGHGEHARGMFRALFSCLEWCLAGGTTLIDIESTWPELASYVDISVRPPWILDDVVTRLRFLCSCGVVTASVCPSRANMPAQALANWAVDTPGEAIFRSLNDLPRRVRALLIHDDVPYVFFDIDDPP